MLEALQLPSSDIAQTAIAVIAALLLLASVVFGLLHRFEKGCFELAYPGRQPIPSFAHLAFGQPGQNDIAHALFSQQHVHPLIHMHQLVLSSISLPSQLPSILQQGLQQPVHVGRLVRQPHIERCQRSQVLELVRIQIGRNNGGFGLDLEEFLEKAEKVRGSLETDQAANVVE